MRKSRFDTFWLIFLPLLFISCHAGQSETKIIGPPKRLHSFAKRLTTPYSLKSDGADVTSGRVFNELESLKKRAKIVDPILLKKFSRQDYMLFGDGNAFITRLEDGRVAIYISHYYYRGYAKLITIKALLAHELGHLKCGHLDMDLESSSLDDPVTEAEADDFALRLVGKKIFIKGFQSQYAHMRQVGIRPSYRLWRIKKYLKNKKNSVFN